ncbi:Flp family type IVb pilin [Polaromonas sp.]|uniref:Flp family type IVb pilin n=1 Tax=Polaromonas sp. TaxID=1869339 RepID=UPI002FCB2FAD
MEKLFSATRRFLRDEEGVTAIEYGLIAALIAVVIITAVAAIGTQLDLTFDNIADCLTTPATC